MAALLRDGVRPIQVQTSVQTPALVHAGPFGNIAHGNCSILAVFLWVDEGNGPTLHVTNSKGRTSSALRGHSFMDTRARWRGPSILSRKAVMPSCRTFASPVSGPYTDRLW
jgi:formyltetrahydrofolate synthetase